MNPSSSAILQNSGSIVTDKEDVSRLAAEYKYLTSQIETYYSLLDKKMSGNLTTSETLRLNQLQQLIEEAANRARTPIDAAFDRLSDREEDFLQSLMNYDDGFSRVFIGNFENIISELKQSQNQSTEFSSKLSEIENKVLALKNLTKSGFLNSQIDLAQISKLRQEISETVSNLKKTNKTTNTTSPSKSAITRSLFKNPKANVLENSTDSSGLSDEDAVRLSKEYEVLTGKVKEYFSALNKIKSGKPIDETTNPGLERLITLLGEAYKKADAYKGKSQELTSACEEFKSVLESGWSSSSNNIVDNLTKMLDKMKSADSGSEEFGKRVKKVHQDVEDLKKELDSKKVFPKNDLKNLQVHYKTLFEEVFKLSSEYSNVTKGVSEITKQTALTNLAQWMEKNTIAADQYKKKLNEIVLAIKNAKTAEEFDNAIIDLKKLQEEVSNAGKTGISFAEKLKAKFGELAQYLLSFASFDQIISTLKQGIEIVKKYDTAFTEMRKVTDASTTSLRNFQKASFDIADQVGTTGEQLQQSTADWLRLGESFDDAIESAKQANILMNVSEFTSIDDATTSLVAMSQAYQELSKGEIVDKLNNVG